MRKLWCAAVLVVTLVSVVRPQCISNNDKLVVTSPPDLAHITPFSLDLFKQLNPPTAKGNFFFSPYSVWTALVLAYFGSAGRTRQQLQDTLRLRDPSTTLATYRALDRLNAERQSNTSDYVIDLANKVYVKSGFPLRDCIRDVLKKEVENIDFSQAAKAAATINQFVNKTTRGKIPTVVTESDVARTLMALVNAVYFKGFWLSQFNLTQTTKQKFFTTPSQHSLVDMMTQLQKFRFGVSSELGATVLEMPYKGKAASMLVLLPHNTPGGAPRRTSTPLAAPGNSATPLDAMLRRLSHDTLRHALTNLREEKVHLHFPRFKLEQAITEELKAALEALGIEDLFSSRSDLTNYVRGTSLSVNTVIHKAVVEVNEEGSEAAAATVISIERGPGPRVFRCDRPFVFFIRDNHTNAILFMGVYRKP
ncbi:leukocyte elastase inhibitor-like [Procambarus clarkii]|uniref:leukocyte elastase inhibitor-like n=1 Tax=Procambarus clarkii TaxID=6728 RepID=UPI0037429CCD